MRSVLAALAIITAASLLAPEPADAGFGRAPGCSQPPVFQAPPSCNTPPPVFSAPAPPVQHTLPPTVVQTPDTTVQIPGQTITLPPTMVTIPGQQLTVPGATYTAPVPQFQVPGCVPGYAPCPPALDAPRAPKRPLRSWLENRKKHKGMEETDETAAVDKDCDEYKKRKRDSEFDDALAALFRGRWYPGKSLGNVRFRPQPPKLFLTLRC